MKKIRSLLEKSWIVKAFFGAGPRTWSSLVKGYFNRKQYYPKDDLNAPMKKLMYCMLCPNMCRFDCPAVQASKKETHSPADKARIAYYLEMGYLDITAENLFPLLEGCLHCSACQEWCPFDFAVGDLLEGVARDFFHSTNFPQELKDFDNRIKTHNGLYPNRLYSEANTLLEKCKKGDIYYYPGCVTKGNNPHVIEGILSIAEAANASLVSKPKEQWCCGSAVNYIGDQSLVEKLAAHNSALINEQDISMVICECPECAYTLKERYPNLGYTLDVPVYHISEWVSSLYDEGKIQFSLDRLFKNRTIQTPISYHDPCILARKLKVIDEPRKLLKAIFGESFLETPYTKEKTHCCGYGGVVNLVNPDLSSKIAKNRLKEFAELDIKTIITNCPTCWYAFTNNNKDFSFTILDLIEILIMVIK
jgi:Fe-S oxidoreductase